MYNGILICNKPQDFTSHDVVAKLRGVLGQRKIGHAGTLDPMATGVLIILLGSGTKTSDDILGMEKTYITALRPGIVSNTQDIWGDSITGSPVFADEGAVREAAAALTGEIFQTPPMFSAIKIKGQKLYSLARRGIDVEREKRPVTVHSIELLPREALQSADLLPQDIPLKVTCSKGTYVRTLCHDLGQALGTGGAMSYLKRQAVGPFSLEKSLSLAQIEAEHKSGTLGGHIIPTHRVYSHLAPVTLNGQGEKIALNGGALYAPHIKEGGIPQSGQKCRVFLQNGDFYMVATAEAWEKGPCLKCHKTFFSKG